MNFIALAWWVLAGESLCVQITSRLIHEGDEHEIKIEGDEDKFFKDRDGADNNNRDN